MMTLPSINSFIHYNKLHVVLIPTSDVIGCDAVHVQRLHSACGVISNITANTVINPVMVANLHEWKIR